VVTDVAVTKSIGGEGLSGRIAKRKQGRRWARGAKTREEIVGGTFPVFEPTDTSAEDRPVSGSGMNVSELLFEVLKVVVERRRTRVKMTLRTEMLNTVFKMVLMTETVFGELI
jgi:hypothetical protein